MSCTYTSLAQSVEQLAVNQWVVGSSPTRGAKVAELIIRIIRDEQDTDRNNLYKNNGLYICSISSIGGTLPCQGRGYGFDPRMLLQKVVGVIKPSGNSLTSFHFCTGV